MFGEHYPPAFTQASPAFCHPSAAFSFTSQLMNRQQSKNYIPRIRSQRPSIVGRWQSAGSRREAGAGAMDGSLGHLPRIKMIEKLPLHAAKPLEECRRGLIKSAMAKDCLAHVYSTQRAFEPTPAIKIGPIIDEVGNA